MEVLLIVKAIVAAATAIGGKDPGTGLQEIFKEYTDMIYPDRAHKLEDKALRTKKILEREFAKGAMKVEAQNYDKKPRKKRR